MCFNTKCSTFGRSVCYNCSVGSNCVIEVISFSSFSLKCYTLKYFSDEIFFFLCRFNSYKWNKTSKLSWTSVLMRIYLSSLNLIQGLYNKVNFRY